MATPHAAPSLASEAAAAPPLPSQPAPARFTPGAGTVLPVCAPLPVPSPFPLPVPVLVPSIARLGAFPTVPPKESVIHSPYSSHAALPGPVSLSIFEEFPALLFDVSFLQWYEPGSAEGRLLAQALQDGDSAPGHESVVVTAMGQSAFLHCCGKSCVCSKPVPLA